VPARQATRRAIPAGRRRCDTLGGLAVGVALGVTGALPAAAPAAVMTGKLTGTRLVAGSDVGLVRAVKLPSLTVQDAARTSRRGKYRLQLGSGRYVVVGTIASRRAVAPSLALAVTRVRGRRAPRAALRLRRGKRPDACKRVTRKRRAACRKVRRRALARVSASAPTVGIETFSSSGDNPRAGKGLSEMLMTDMTNISAGDCDPVVIERIHAQDLLNELLAQQGPFFDPRTRAPFNPSPVRYSATGRVSTSGRAMTWSVSVTDTQSGQVVASDAGSAEGSATMTASEGIARRLTDALCGARAPFSYSGTVTGTRRTTHAAQDTTETWTATDVVYERNPASDDTQPYYDLKGGTVDYTVSGSIYVNCQISGSGTFPLTPASGGGGQIVYSGLETYNANGFANPTAAVQATITCPEESHTAPYYLPEILVTNPTGEEHQPGRDGVLSGSASMAATPGSTGSTEWHWSLSPHS
jgi:hypothetical protein